MTILSVSPCCPPLGCLLLLVESMLGMGDDFREAGTVGKDAGCQHPLPNVWQEPLDEVILQVCHIGGRERPWIVG